MAQVCSLGRDGQASRFVWTGHVLGSTFLVMPVAASTRGFLQPLTLTIKFTLLVLVSAGRQTERIQDRPA